jgi:hypothetical protein
LRVPPAPAQITPSVAKVQKSEMLVNRHFTDADENFVDARF